MNGDPVLQNLELIVHVDIFLYTLLRFHLIMMFGFTGSAGSSDFVRNKWERRGMHTDVYFYI
jgi:hypothetical protein